MTAINSFQEELNKKMQECEKEKDITTKNCIFCVIHNKCEVIKNKCLNVLKRLNEINNKNPYLYKQILKNVEIAICNDQKILKYCLNVKHLGMLEVQYCFKEIKKQVDLYEEWNPICCQNGNPGIGWFSGDHPQCCGNCKGFIII